MGQKGKILVTEEGNFDLTAYRWDDHRFTDLLVRENAIDTDKAMDISRFLRDKIARLEVHTITMPIIEKIIEDKLLENGLTKPSPIRLDKSIFVKKGMALSENARKVLERRYLKKDAKGRVIEQPEQMFRRVAHHIARAEKKYGDADHVKKMEEIFCSMMVESKFLPNSPTLMNAGRRLGQLAACFVLPVEDSMGGIFNSLNQ